MIAAAPPIPPLTREAARTAARHELSKPIYHRNDEPLVLRVLNYVRDHIAHYLSNAANAAPGGWLGLAGVLIAVALVIAVIRWRIGPLQRSARSARALFDMAIRSAAEHRATAERFAADGDWAQAVRERLRALARDLEERGVLDAHPGRTADEIAADAAGAFPSYDSELRAAANVFDEIWYGGRTAQPESYELVRRVDDNLRSAPLVHVQ
jgi:uncharacterized protein DUF4129